MLAEYQNSTNSGSCSSSSHSGLHSELESPGKHWADWQIKKFESTKQLQPPQSGRRYEESMVNILAAGQEVALIIANSLRLTASLLSWKEESSPADSREAC